MPERRRQREPQRDEREIGDDEVDRLRQLEALAGVDPLHHAHAFVAPQLPVELPFADIDGIDPRRAALQQTIGEPARRRSDIERDEARHVEAEVVQRALELLAASGGETRTGFDGDDRILGHRRRRTVGSVARDTDRTREDERLRALAAGCELSLHEQLIQAHASLHAAILAQSLAVGEETRAQG